MYVLSDHKERCTRVEPTVHGAAGAYKLRRQYKECNHVGLHTSKCHHTPAHSRC